MWRPAGRAEESALPVDFYATRPHYMDHLAPVYAAMTRNRGRFCVPDELVERARAAGIETAPVSDLAASRGPIACSSYRDLSALCASKRHLILFEHGAGFSFSNSHPSYAGGTNRRGRVGLFCCPNDWAQRRNLNTYRGCRAEIVGSPPLDALLALPKPTGRTVAIAFHWDCRIAPETRSAYEHFAAALPELAERFDLIGHAHPNNADAMRAVFEDLGIEFVADFAEVCKRASLYVNDASSTLYEFAALGRPVVVMNAPWYRRHVDHGLRFWEFADVGVQCDDPARLADAVDEAFEDSEHQQALRLEAVDGVYPYLGEASARAAHVLEHYAEIAAGATIYPDEPVPLPEGACVVSPGADAGLRSDLERWHGCKAHERWPEGARFVADLDPTTRLRGSLLPAFAALEEGWDLVRIQKAYDHRAAGKPRQMEFDERAVFYRVGADGEQARAWVLHPSFALEWGR